MKLMEIAQSRFAGYKLVSSNINKLAEFNRFGLKLDIEKGKDLPEVDGTPYQVITHKAKDAGPLHIVEDTSFDVEGMNVGVNVRWLIDQLVKDPSIAGRKAKWTVLLGVNTGEAIEIYEGVVTGIISPAAGNGFGFDPIFVPTGSDKTLAQLEEVGQKDNFSARKKAVMNMLSNMPKSKVMMQHVEKWTGGYQH